ncbi:GbsR/MarR family transcriptional regulator [Amycolatopsis sp. NPDC004378]
MTLSAGGERTLIEDFGLRIGRAMGWPPMAGRTSGVLMLSEKPLTLDELQDALGASKGSVSEMTRLLMVNGVVERYKEPGSRHFVHRWRDDAWIGCLQHQVTMNRELLELAETAQDQGKHLPPEQRGRLRQMRDYYVFMTEQLEALLAEYTRRASG